MGLQAALRLIYPPRCISCDEAVSSDFGLCGPCWRDTPFIAGTVCDCCGTPIPGEDHGPARCDDCITLAHPWTRGRAAMMYGDNARRMILALKHGDRMDLAVPAGKWLHRAAAPILLPDMVAAPVPLHWRRMLKRRYNQAALLAGALARAAGIAHCPDLLSRTRFTRSQEGRTREGRYENMAGALHVPRPARIAGRPVLLVDDVMTSGATLAAAAEACFDAGASDVRVVVLARVAKTP